MSARLSVVYPSAKDKWRIADLWQKSFNDSPAYIELFFTRVYRPENTLVIKRDGLIVSALQMLPYKAKFDDSILPVAYICGACTHPLERGQGLMKTLMRHAKLEMSRRGFALSVLIPAEPSLFDYYRVLGFSNTIYHPVEYLNDDDFSADTVDSCYPLRFEESTVKHFDYFNRKQQERGRTVIHDAYDYETILQELKSYGGKSFVAFHDNTPAGIAFAEKISNDTVHVKEVMADSEKVFSALYGYAFRLFDARRLKICDSRHAVKQRVAYGLGCNLDDTDRRLSRFSMSLMHD